MVFILIPMHFKASKLTSIPQRLNAKKAMFAMAVSYAVSAWAVPSARAFTMENLSTAGNTTRFAEPQQGPKVEASPGGNRNGLVDTPSLRGGRARWPSAELGASQFPLVALALLPADLVHPRLLWLRRLWLLRVMGTFRIC